MQNLIPELGRNVKFCCFKSVFLEIALGSLPLVSCHFHLFLCVSPTSLLGSVCDEHLSLDWFRPSWKADEIE